MKQYFFIYLFVSVSRILYFGITPKTIVIYLSRQLPGGSSGTSRLCVGTRPCTRVRILPFHPHVTMRLSRQRRDPFVFQLRRHCSHLLACARRVLPATFLPQKWGVSGLSSSRLRKEADATIRYKHSNFNRKSLFVNKFFN